jgi:UDP-N-acetylmuramate--alanine ligase
MLKSFHLIGIGGIGMSCLAKLLIQKGCTVSGSDAKKSQMTESLEKLGATIFYGHDGKNLSEKKRVIVSSGIPQTNPELIKAQELNYPILHRSDLLDELMQGYLPLMVAGAHGKTTTTSLLAYVLDQAAFKPSFAIGGESTAFLSHGFINDGKYFVFEGDESDGSFLKTKPFGAIFTNIDAEHLEYWKTYDALQKAFEKAMSDVISPSLLFYCADDLIFKKMGINGISYGVSKDAQIRAENIEQTLDGCYFDCIIDEKKIERIFIRLRGIHNVVNSLGVFGMCRALGVSEALIRKAFESFPGVKRRLEFLGEHEGTTFLDDYAHHPNEIKAVFSALTQTTKSKKTLFIVQPHKFTRVNDLLKDFQEALSVNEDLVLLAIYGAGQAEIEGLFEKLVSGIRAKQLFVLRKEEIDSWLNQQAKAYECIVTLGAGDVTAIGRNYLKGNQV